MFIFAKIFAKNMTAPENLHILAFSYMCTSGKAIASANVAKNVQDCVIIKAFVITNKWVSSNRTILSVIWLI